MDRRDVYKLIDGEREYQLRRHDGATAEKPHRDEDHHVADWLTYIEAHIGKCKNCIYYLDTAGAMSEMRKVAALAVAAMEYIIDTPKR